MRETHKHRAEGRVLLEKGRWETDTGEEKGKKRKEKREANMGKEGNHTLVYTATSYDIPREGVQ